MDLGGPESLSDVPLFAERLLADPSVLPGPAWLRRRAARAIAQMRAPQSRAKYQAIGGASPLPTIVTAQAKALHEALAAPFVVRPAFRFSAPSVESALRALHHEGIQRVVVVPTFPQYSETTAGTCLRAAREAAARLGLELATTPSFPSAEGFITCLSDVVRPVLEDVDWLLLTAHGLPESLIRKGDPYQREVEATAAALADSLGLAGDDGRWSLAYQSRLGPTRWLQPYVADEIQRVLALGVKRLCVVPISFACENLETRYDLDLEAAELARRSGCTRYRRAPTPGLHRLFIDQLAHLARAVADEQGWTGGRIASGEVQP
jgi:ferrochelatase